MPAELADILIYLGLMTFICLIAWIGQWGRKNNIARYFVLFSIGFTGGALVLMGLILFLVTRIQHQIYIPINTDAVGLLFSLMGVCAIPALIPPVRRLLAKTVFPGLETSTPAHTWALYIFLSSLVMTLISITLLYDPDTIAQSLRSMPLSMMAGVNALSFLFFAFVASGVWIYQPFKQTAINLGLKPLPWRTVFAMVGIALVLSVAIQFLEAFLTPFVDPHMRQAIQKVVDAMKTGGGVRQTLTTASIVGLSAGIGEETLFRGLIQPVFGLVPTAILFTLIHTHYGPSLLLLELFAVGLTLGFIRNKYNTTAAIIVHSGFDFFAISSSLIHH